MTQEWQQATNERFRELGIEPISGPGNPDYKVRLSLMSSNLQGKGVIHGDFVNRKSRAVKHDEDEEE